MMVTAQPGFGQRLAKAMGNRLLTCNRLAELMGVGSDTVMKWIDGSWLPDTGHLLVLQVCLGVV